MLTPGRNLVDWARHQAFKRGFSIELFGQWPTDRHQQVLVAANHRSHLDYGVVKFALEGRCTPLSALAAADYFFDRRWKRRILLPFTDLIPVMRQGHLNLALKGAETALSAGRSLLVFPEGTRAFDQVLPFRPGIGYLQRRSLLPVLPLYISGTERILPKGQALPTGRTIKVWAGPLIHNAEFDTLCEGLETGIAYREVSNEVRTRILKMANLPVSP